MIYKTNQQAWDDVVSEINKHEALMKIANKLFPSETPRKNFIGLTTDQRNQVWDQYPGE